MLVLVRMQLVDKHGEVTGSVTYSATAHDATQHEGQQQLKSLSSGSSRSEHYSLPSKGSDADGAEPSHDFASGIEQAAGLEQQHQNIQPMIDNVNAQELTQVESEAFIYSSTGKLPRPCCQSLLLR